MTDPLHICVHSLTLLGVRDASEPNWPALVPDHETAWRIDLRDPPPRRGIGGTSR